MAVAAIAQSVVAIDTQDEYLLLASVYSGMPGHNPSVHCRCGHSVVFGLPRPHQSPERPDTRGWMLAMQPSGRHLVSEYLEQRGWLRTFFGRH